MTTHCACSEQFDQGSQREQMPETRLDLDRTGAGYFAGSIFWSVMKGIFIASVATVAIPALLFLCMTLLADVMSFKSAASMLVSRADGYMGMLMLLNLVLVLLGFTVPEILTRKAAK